MFGIKTRLLELWNKYQVDHCPQKVIDKTWLKTYGHKIDWNHPINMSTKKTYSLFRVSISALHISDIIPQKR